MLSFLSSFSISFLAAILIWPFLAAALTLPILILQYRRYNKISFGYSVLIYLFILYALGLVSFTLYPMPDNPAVFCADYNLSPVLNPLTAIMDIRTDGMRAVLQLVMNVAFFVPFGMFAKVLFGWKFWPSILGSFLLSLVIETAQLTGVFGLYPCSYRLFDTNDLMVNTLGGAVGYALALLIPKRELERVEKDVMVRKAGLLRMVVALVIDQIVVIGVGMSVLLTVYLFIDKEMAMEIREWVMAGTLVAIHVLIPYIAHGWSIGSRMVRYNHDDIRRSMTRRLAFYVLRGVYLWLLIMAPIGVVTPLLILLTLLVWWKWKKLPYQFV